MTARVAMAPLAGAAGSLALHALVAAWAAGMLLTARAIPPAPASLPAVAVTARDVAVDRARQTRPEGAEAPPAEVAPNAVNDGPVPMLKGAPLAPPGQWVAAEAAGSAPAPPLRPRAAPLAAQTVPTQPTRSDALHETGLEKAASTPLSTTPVAPVATDGPTTRPVPDRARPVGQLRATAGRISGVAGPPPSAAVPVGDAPAMGAVAPPDTPLRPRPGAGQATSPLSSGEAEVRQISPPTGTESALVTSSTIGIVRDPEGTTQTATAPDGALVEPDDNAGDNVPSGPSLPAQVAAADLAWTGAPDGAIDPATLPALRAFLPALAPPGGDIPVRDGILGALAAIPCARLQTAFDAETGRVKVTGHIPEDGLRGPLRAALSAQLGPDLPLDDATLVLPRPQCGTLAALDAIGLPQSADQPGDAVPIGAEPQARTDRFAAGDRFALALATPDYPAFIHIDYFDAAGTVLHLSPSPLVPLERHPPTSTYRIGGSDDDRLRLTITPPFGREIAVAIATTAPIFDTPRPVSEPAEVYLTALTAALSQRRAADPTFRGEWAYFLVETGP